MDGLRRAVVPTATAAAVALLLTACAGGGTSDPSPSFEQIQPPRPTPAEMSVPVTADVAGVAAFLEVGPVVRDGDLAVLHVRLTGQDPERPLEAAALGLAGPDGGGTTADEVRLLDPESAEVRLAALDGDGGRAAGASAPRTAAGDPMRVTAVYAAPSGDTTAVLLPTVGLVDRVPVVDAADAPGDLPSLDEVLGTLGVARDGLTAPVVEAEAPREPVADGADGAGGAAAVGPAGEGVTVTLPAADAGVDHEVHVAVDEVRSVGGVLVGTVRVTLRSGVPTRVGALFAGGLTLLHDGERVGPLAHPTGTSGEGSTTPQPLADTALDRTLGPGEALRVTVVWPDVGADEVTVDAPADEVTVDAPAGEASADAGAAGSAWRVTGVPVHRGS